MYRLTFFLLFFNHAFSQDTLSPKASINKQYIKSYVLDSRDILIAPVKWKPKQWVITAGVLGTAGFLITQDKEINNFFQKNRTNTTDEIAKYGFEPFGRGIYSMGVMGLFYLQGCIFHNERSKKVALLGVKAFLITGGLTTIPKVIFCRHRPREEDQPDPYLWDFPAKDLHHLSFFSGHTSTAFAVATIVSCEYKEHWWVPVISYTIAGLTGLSRINDNAHWPSDVFMGAAFGTAVGKLIYSHNNWRINITPYKTSNSTGMLICVPIH
ncbi:MAG: phosphatase PAP2 family protein [Bacteroidia bacterium]|nr:phosphatase PAP2 family protein [Bacteroidia bacterium]